LYAVDGSGRAKMSSSDGDGACDILSPICTVAEEATDESLRCPSTRGPPPKIEGGGCSSLISYMELGSFLDGGGFTGLVGSVGNSE